MTTALWTFLSHCHCRRVHDELCFYRRYHIKRRFTSGSSLKERNLNLLRFQPLKNIRPDLTMPDTQIQLMAIKKGTFYIVLNSKSIDKESKNMNLWWEWDERQCSFNHSRKTIEAHWFFSCCFLVPMLYLMSMMVMIKIRESGCGKIFFSKNFSLSEWNLNINYYTIGSQFCHDFN